MRNLFQEEKTSAYSFASCDETHEFHADNNHGAARPFEWMKWFQCADSRIECIRFARRTSLNCVRRSRVQSISALLIASHTHAAIFSTIPEHMCLCIAQEKWKIAFHIIVVNSINAMVTVASACQRKMFCSFSPPSHTRAPSFIRPPARAKILRFFFVKEHFLWRATFMNSRSWHFSFRGCSVSKWRQNKAFA